MKTNKKFLLSILLLPALSVLILPNTVFAAVTITSLVSNVASVITKIAVFVVVVFWIITGLLFLTAQGDPTKLGTAKKALIYAIIGTAIAFLAGSASTIIGNALLFGG